MQLYWQEKNELAKFVYMILNQVTISIPCGLGCAFCKSWPQKMKKLQQENILYIKK